MDVYKCIVAKLPKARTAVFTPYGAHSLTFIRFLNFLHFTLDDEHPYSDESPYLEVLEGDSGSGFWADSFVDGEYRKTIVAVVMSGYGLKPLSDFSDLDPKAKHECRMFATKLTDEIILWIKRKITESDTMEK